MKEKKQELRILYLEENQVSVKLVETILRESLPEFEMKLAKTEKEFLKFIIRFNPDVILSEYQLEKYSATEAFELLQQEKYNIPFIFVTNKLSEEACADWVKKGIEGCVLKSNLAQLPQLVLKAIDKKRISSLKDAAENLLKQEQERHGTIFKNTAEAIINIGFDGQILEINPTGLNMLQVKGSQNLNRKHIFEFIHPDDVKRFRKFHNSAGIGNRKKEVFRILGSRNEEHWVETNAIPMFDEEQHVVSVLTINHDVTEKLKSQKEIIYRATLLENVSDAIVSFGNDRYILSWNPAAEKLFGWKEKEIKGKLITDVLQTKFLDSTLEKVLEEKKNKGKWSGKLSVISKSGIELIVSANSATILDEREEVIGSVTTYRDITEQVRSRRLINYHSTLFANIQDPIISLDPDMRIRSWNDGAERLYGWSAEEVTGKHFPDFTTFEIADEEVRKILHNLSLTGHWEGEMKLRAKNGKVLTILVSSSSIKDDNNSIMGYVAVHRDITERRLADIAWKESELRLKTAQEIANIGYWDRDIATQKGIWSPQLFKIFERDESSGAPSAEEFLNYVHVDDRAGLLRIQENLLQNEDKITHHYRLFLGDGKLKHIFAISLLIKDEQGVPYKMMGTAMDVTELVQAKEHALVSESKFKELFENSPDAIYVEDEYGTVLDANKVACTFQGYEKEELVGKNIFTLAPEHQKQELQVRYDSVFNMDGLVTESFAWHKDGSSRPIEIKSNRIFYNQKPAVLIHARDISKRRAAEKAKRESEIMCSTLINQGPVGIFRADNSGKFVQCNNKFLEIFEIAEEEARTGEWKNRIHPMEISKFNALMNELLETEKIVETNYRLMIDDRIKFVHVTFNSLCNDDGVQVGRILSFLDITDSFKSKETTRLTQTVFQSVFEYSPDAILIEDMEGLILNVNERACQLYGLELSEMVGKSIADVVPPGMRSEVMQNHRRFCDLSLQRLKTSVTNKEGKEIPVETRANLINYFDQVALLLHLTVLEN